MLLIIFSNLTITTKFKKLAAKSGIGGVRIIQTPRELSSSGCSYAVRAKFEAKNELFDLMEESRMFPTAVFKVDSLTKGKLSYVKIK